MPLFPVVCKVVPVSVAPVGFVASDICTVAPAMEWPRLSTTSTFTAGVICDAVDEVLLGCTVKLIDRVEATLIAKEAVADCCGELESAAFTVKEYIPVDVGEPLITPDVLSVIPGGSSPLAKDHVTGVLPPVEVKVWL